MIETIVTSNPERFICFEINSYYRIFIDVQTRYFRITYRTNNDLDLLSDGYVQHFDINRLPFLIEYLQTISKSMEGDSIMHRLLRIFLICVYE